MAEQFDKSGLRYSFEKVHGDKPEWQVRIKGQFIMYTDKKDSDYVDSILADEGYNSREEIYKDTVRESIAFLMNDRL